MSRPRIVLFANHEVGHFRRMVPLMQGLGRRGARVDVFTHPCFAAEVRAAGATFTDLFDGCPQDAADDASRPVACRSVAFAGRYADVIAERLARDRPALILHDTFAVIGHVVGRLLELPVVNVCAGHNVNPAEFLATLAVDPRVSVSPACHAAVARLRADFGIAEASPFFYVSALSTLLNLCCEPPEYLAPHERQAFAPLAFFGSLSDASLPTRRPAGAPSLFGAEGAALKVYVSFGTVVWRYYANEALAALAVIAAELSARPGTQTLVSLGGHEISEAERAALELPGVRVVPHVAQREVLSEADVFITHHGMNSTHEAVYHRVPMLSYPFFWDQPALAARCRQFGIARPLTTTPRGPLQRSDVASALEAVIAADFLQPELAVARGWELAVMDSREAVFDRLMAYASGTVTLGLGCGVEVRSNSAVALDALLEFFGDWPERGAVADFVVECVLDSTRCDALQREVAGDPGDLRGVFRLDTETVHLPTWRRGERTLVFDAFCDCWYVLQAGRLTLVSHAGAARLRLGLLRAVREVVCARSSGPGTRDLHAAAVELDGRAVLLCGRKRAGKSTLLCHLLGSGRARLLANDRVQLRGGDGPLVARGIPTVVRLRPPAASGVPPWPRDAQQPATEARLLSPAQLCAQLGARSVAEAPVGAILHLEIVPDGSGLTLSPLTLDAARARLRASRYGVPDEAPTLIEELARRPAAQHVDGGARTPEATTVPDERLAFDDRVACDERVARLPQRLCRLGEEAYAAPASALVAALQQLWQSP